MNISPPGMWSNCSVEGVTVQSVALMCAVVRVRIYQGINYGRPVLDECMEGQQRD